MSGIAAIIHVDGSRANPALIRQMTAAMAYRGPDGIAHWPRGTDPKRQGPAALGHCQMQVSAESLEDDQPLCSVDDSTVLVMDGYVANYDGLRAELQQRGAHLRSRSDAELVLGAYAAWGADCPKHIDGEYAFVIWDATRREAFCARDHHGLRPLFWHFDGSRLVVASDIAPVLEALQHPPAVNLGYLAEIAVDETYSPAETVWKDVRRLLPAHSLTLTTKGPQLREYWTLLTDVSIRYKSDGEYFEHYRSVLGECVRQASRTHLPLAFEVSGGLDSSSLFCVAHELAKDGRLLAPSIAGYTLAGPEGTAAHELTFARAVGAHVGRPLTEVPLYIPELDWFAQRSRDDRDMAPFPNAAMSIGMDRAIRADGSRVAINGVGGDQWLDGAHFYYRELLAAGQWRKLLAAYREDAADYGALLASKTFLRLGPGSYLPGPVRRLRRRLKGTDQNAWEGEHSWLSEPLQAALAARQARYETSFPQEYRNSYKLRKLKLPRWTQVLDLISRQRAREGLENRSPMMSRAFIEFSAGTPERMRLRGAVTKYIHREALAGIIPKEVANRTSKAEFSTVFQHHDEQLRAEALSPAIRALSQLVNSAGLEKLFDKYRDATIDERCTGEIWGIYVCKQILELDAELREKGS